MCEYDYNNDPPRCYATKTITTRVYHTCHECGSCWAPGTRMTHHKGINCEGDAFSLYECSVCSKMNNIQEGTPFHACPFGTEDEGQPAQMDCTNPFWREVCAALCENREPNTDHLSTEARAAWKRFAKVPV